MRKGGPLWATLRTSRRRGAPSWVPGLQEALRGAPVPAALTYLWEHAGRSRRPRVPSGAGGAASQSQRPSGRRPAPSLPEACPRPPGSDRDPQRPASSKGRRRRGGSCFSGGRGRGARAARCARGPHSGAWKVPRGVGARTRPGGAPTDRAHPLSGQRSTPRGLV